MYLRTNPNTHSYICTRTFLVQTYILVHTSDVHTFSKPTFVLHLALSYLSPASFWILHISLDPRPTLSWIKSLSVRCSLRFSLKRIQCVKDLLFNQNPSVKDFLSVSRSTGLKDLLFLMGKPELWLKDLRFLICWARTLSENNLFHCQKITSSSSVEQEHCLKSYLPHLRNQNPSKRIFSSSSTEPESCLKDLLPLICRTRTLTESSSPPYL